MTARLVVIGGGLAGIAAAVRLAEAGLNPLVLETSKRLGGRATSFEDAHSGELIDNCQHVVLGCCTALLDLYDRLDVLNLIDWHDTLYWTAGNGEVGLVKCGVAPAPFHLAGSFMKLPFLTKADRKAIRSAMWRLIRMGGAGRQAWAGRAFSEFLAEHNQPEHAVEVFWEVVITSACNVGVTECDAAYAIQVFQEGFLGNRIGYSMGLATVPLRKLYDPAIARIESLGGDVVDGVAAQSLAYDGRRVTGVVTRDGMINVSAVVCGVPPNRLARLVSETMRCADSRLQRLDEFEFSPILGVHLWFSDRVMPLPHVVTVGMGLQWLFNKGTTADGLQHIHAVISAADDWMGLDEEEIVDRVVRDVHRALPTARGLEPVRARAIKEKRATFRLAPGVDQLRPRAQHGTMGLSGGGIENLYIAGDWSDTGWPATMEGAVRSGYSAAGSIVGTDLSVEDLPPGALARVLGLKW